MKLRYIANACFLIELASGRRVLTDPWFQGPCQQTWWNFPPVHERLAAEIRACRPDLLYISHLHHDHLHAETLAPFDRATPVLIGAMNTPNLKNALAALGFRTLIEVPFESRTPLADTGADVVLFKDFHGNTLGDETQVAYDLDTSLYLYDRDGTRLFLGVDNTLLPADATRIAAQYGRPDIAQLPYVSASLFPMAMSDYDEADKQAATDALRLRTAANFRELTRALAPKRVIPAGGEYVLGGPAAPLSRFLPQPLGADLARELESIGMGQALAKLYPGDELDSATMAVIPDPDAEFRDFTDADRAAYAMTLADRAPSFTGIVLPDDLAFDWGRALKKCAANYAARRERIGFTPAMDVYLDAAAVDGARKFLFRFALDGPASDFCDAEGERPRLTYRLDARLLFALVTGLASWNAMEASALIGVSRQPDVYTHDLHRSMVHVNLLAWAAWLTTPSPDRATLASWQMTPTAPRWPRSWPATSPRLPPASANASPPYPPRPRRVMAWPAPWPHQAMARPRRRRWRRRACCTPCCWPAAWGPTCRVFPPTATMPPASLPSSTRRSTRPPPRWCSDAPLPQGT
jgi:L-ascorbate metabolism protein UlaG (beta-lactamase superfamily)